MRRRVLRYLELRREDGRPRAFDPQGHGGMCEEEHGGMGVGAAWRQCHGYCGDREKNRTWQFTKKNLLP